MAPFALLSGRGLAQVSELASPLVGSVISARFPGSSYQYERESDRVPSPPSAIFARSSDSPVNPIPQLPSTTAGLIGFICFLVVGIMIIGGWRVIRWRRRRQDLKQSGVLPTVDPLSEKRLRPFILVPPLPLSPSVRWAPAKLSPWLDPHMPRKPTPSVTKESVLSRPTSWSFDPTPKSVHSFATALSSSSSEYPSSTESKVDSIHVTLPALSYSSPHVKPSPPMMAELTRLPPADNAQSQSLKPTCPPGLEIPNPRVQSIVSPSQLGDSSKVSPVGTDDPSETDSELGTEECSPVIESCAQPGYPKLVIVRRSFTVTLPDELKVREGDRLRILREFKDGWTLCQRISRRNPEKGAVPRCCLAELRVNTSAAEAGKKLYSSKGVNEKG